MKLVDQTNDMSFNPAELLTAVFRIIESGCSGSCGLADMFEERAEQGLTFGNAVHHFLVGLEQIRHGLETLLQAVHDLKLLHPAFFAARDDILQRFKIFSRLFQQGLNIGRDRGVASFNQRAALLGNTDQPFLDFVKEAVLCLTGIEIEKAEDQRARKTEHGAGESRGHALEWFGETCFELAEHGIEIAVADAHASDDACNGTDCQKKAVECAEQAEIDQQTGHIARDVTRFVQAA